MSEPNTATKLLDAAEDLVRQRGFNAFSYADLSETVGIRTASIHYHFKGKAELGQALIQRFLNSLDENLAEIDRKSRSNRARLRAFMALYRDVEQSGAICLCGSMASDLETLPPDVRATVDAYFQRSESWVAEKLTEGVRDGEFVIAGKPKNLATSLIAGLQGGLLVARARGTQSVIQSIEQNFLACLEKPE